MLELGKTPHSLEGYREMTTILLSWGVEEGTGYYPGC